MYTVYLRTNTINGKQYVGQTGNFRLRNNQWNCLTQHYANNLLTQERNEYGLENFKTEILAEVETQEESFELEEYYIKELNTKYPNGYNKGDGGENNNGVEVLFERRKKISEINKGKHHSPSTEFKKGMTSWIKGKHHSPEAIEKNRQAHIGKISKKRKVIEQLTLDGEFVREFSHCSAAAKELGIKSAETIRKACVETWRTSCGFKWRYKKVS